jgi:hypothetical protein
MEADLEGSARTCSCGSFVARTSGREAANRMPHLDPQRPGCYNSQVPHALGDSVAAGLPPKSAAQPVEEPPVLCEAEKEVAR